VLVACVGNVLRGDDGFDLAVAARRVKELVEELVVDLT
jgi:Ni,Fe-hydrogenase maturation factor